MSLRNVDYVIGGMVIGTLSAFKKKEYLPSRIKSIGMLKTRGIGDLVVASGLIRSIKTEFNSDITLYADKQTSAACEIIKGVDRVIRIDAMHPVRSILTIRKNEYDMFIDLGAWARVDALMSCASRSRCKVGFATKGQHRDGLFDISVHHSSDQHEALNYLDIASAIGVRSPIPSPWVYGPDEVKSMDEYTEFNGVDKYIIVHIKAGGSNPSPREWCNEKWAEVANKYIKDGYSVVLSGSPDDYKNCAELESMIRTSSHKVINIAGKYSLHDMLPIIYNSSCVLSVNTGLMHVAGACNVPTVGLCGPTNPLRWGPLGTRSICVTPDSGNCCYLDLGFEYKSRNLKCMNDISVESVLEAVSNILRS